MIGLIMAGGFGTRLGGVPKGLIVVNGQLMINFLKDRLKEAGVEEVYVLTNLVHAKEYWKYVKDGDMKLVIEPSSSDADKLGSVGGFRYFSDLIHWDEILVVACDNYFDFALRHFVNKYRGRNAVVLYNMTGRPNVNMSKYGQVLLNSNNRIVEFYEKPRRIMSYLVSTGIYLFNQKVYKVLEEYYNEGNQLDRFGDFVKYLVKKEEVYGYVVSPEWKWYDIGTKEELMMVGGVV